MAKGQIKKKISWRIRLHKSFKWSVCFENQHSNFWLLPEFIWWSLVWAGNMKLFLHGRLYKLYLESNGIGVTNNLFQFQTTNYMVSPSKVTLSESNELSHSSLPHFYALLEGFFYCYCPLDGLHAFKTGLLNDLLELKEKKSHEIRSGD